MDNIDPIPKVRFTTQHCDLTKMYLRFNKIQSKSCRIGWPSLCHIRWEQPSPWAEWTPWTLDTPVHGWRTGHSSHWSRTQWRQYSSVIGQCDVFWMVDNTSSQTMASAAALIRSTQASQLGTWVWNVHGWGDRLCLYIPTLMGLLTPQSSLSSQIWSQISPWMTGPTVPQNSGMI